MTQYLAQHLAWETVRVAITLALIGIRAHQRIKISKKHTHTGERARDGGTETDRQLEKLHLCGDKGVQRAWK